MSAGQAAHYETLLADHYSWMHGDDRAATVAQQVDLLRRAGMDGPGRCVDLGCGSGFQTQALLEMGADSVLAVDLSEGLLDELRTHVPDDRLSTARGDMLDFAHHIRGPVDTVVCMGDTLTHLESREDVLRLLERVAAVMAPGGRLVLSWRDLSHPPSGVSRFIPLRSSPDRIMTCVLDDAGETVRVTDIVHMREEEEWTMRASEYFKLKLSPEWVRSAVERVGLRPAKDFTERGLTVLSALSALR